MKEVTTKLFFFSELSKDVQEKIAKKERDEEYGITYYNIEDNFTCIVEDTTANLTAMGFNDVKIYYRVTCSQGDGACFDASIDSGTLFSNEEFLKVLTRYLGKDTQRFIKWILPHISYSIQKNSYSNHYCHEKTRHIESETSYYNTDKHRVESLINESTRALQEFYRDLCSSLYNKLEEEERYWYDIDNIIKYMIESEEEECYHKNGNLYRG